MKKIAIRLLYGLIFSIPIMLLTFVIANAGTTQSQPEVQQPQNTQSCQTCHKDFQTNFQQSPHFKVAQMNCTSCHNQVPADHPSEPVPLDRSGSTCATCHTTTFYEWQTSGHRDLGLGCSSCHNPHAASLKAVTPVDQCSTCHKERVEDFTHSAHATKGLTCVDCHMPSDNDPTSPITPHHDHSFKVNISTCNNCHAQDVHSAIAMIHDDNQVQAVAADALANVEKLTVEQSPKPVSPVGFATLSGVFGLAAGAILAPWLERLLRGKKDRQS